ncbi:hypothetical protein ACFQ93_14920 [Streptomyces sp. NPDC056601]|uniref:hypothetical protein n=1 Tax=unclassified Streptomyces TaxID=2593676 RepID=UPI00368CB6AF
MASSVRPVGAAGRRRGGVVARGADPPLGSVRPRIDPVKRDTFLPVKSPGLFARLTGRT